MKSLQIKDWYDNFTVNQSRRKVTNPSWVPIPVRQDGARYRLLMATPGGVEAFGVFMALVEVAARCEIPGVLAREDGTPITELQLSARTGIKTQILSKAIKLLTSPDIGWLISAEIETIPTHPTHTEDTTQKRPSRHKEGRSTPSTLRASSERTPSTLGECSERARPPRARAPDQTRGEEIRQEKTTATDDQAGPTGDAREPSGWLAGQDPRSMLSAIPIREPALSMLANAGATCELIKAEWIGVKREQLQGTRIPNPHGLFINRVCRALGIQPPAKAAAGTNAASVGSQLTPAHLARLAAARANYRPAETG